MVRLRYRDVRHRHHPYRHPLDDENPPWFEREGISVAAARDQPRLAPDRAWRHRVLAPQRRSGAFVAGSSDAKESQEEIQEAISRFFDLPIFVLLGMAIPWEGWNGLGWSGLLLVAAVLLLRRLPAVLTLRPLLGPLRKGYDVLFLGWFGPVGAAALYYAAFSLRETGIEEVWTVGSLIICASVMVHGVTATPLTKLYGRSIQDQ